MTQPTADNDRNDDAPEYTKQYYDDAKIDRMIRESAYYIDDDQTNARQHLVAIIRQLRTERDAERQKNASPPGEQHDTAPDAAERAAITKLLNGVQSGKQQYEQGLIKDQDVLLIAVMAINTLDPLVRKLLAAVERLEAENARLKNDLEIALDMILQGDANHDDLMWADMTHTERFGMFNRPSEGE